MKINLNPKKSFQVGIFCYILLGALLPALVILFLFSRYLTANIHTELVNHVERMQKVAASDVDHLVTNFRSNVAEQSKADFVAALLSANEGVEDSLHKLALHLQKTTQAEFAALYKSNGVGIASTERSPQGFNIHLEFLDKIEMKKEHITPVFIEISTKKEIGFKVDAYAPVTEPFYKYLIGILHEYIYIDKNFIVELKNKTGLEVALFTQEESFIYTTDYMPVLDTSTYRNLIETKEVTTQNSLFLNGTTYHAVLIPLVDEANILRGAIGLLGSEKIIEQSKIFIRRISGLALLSIIFLSFLISHTSTRRVIKPIMEVIASLRKTATGNLGQRIEVTSQNEIGELASSFNKMTEDLQHSRQELLSMKDYTDNIVKSMVDTLIVTDPRGNIKTVNQATIDLLGYTEEALRQKRLEDIIRDEMLQGQNLKEILRSGAVSNHELSYKRQGDKLTPMLFSGSAMRGNSGEIEGIVCIARDITLRKEMEEEAKRIQGRLIHANKMTSLGTMVSGVAHEINNPNNVMMFNAPLVADAWKDALPVLEEYHQLHGDFSLGGLPFQEMKALFPLLTSAISDSSHRIKNIVDNLKNFARRDQRGMDNSINVNEVIGAAVELIDNQIKEITQNFSIECEEGLPLIKGNSQQLEQVMINLIINALQSIPDKTCRVSVSTTTSKSDNREVVVIRVEDEGCGMKNEVMERIMEPFYTTRIDAGGTGLGLSISYTIINEHRGTIEYQSEIGRGTTVTIKLPVCEKENSSDV